MVPSFGVHPNSVLKRGIPRRKRKLHNNLQ